MTAEFERYISELEQVLSLLRALAEQFVACRKEFVAMDLDGIYRCIAGQEEICRQIQSLQSASGARPSSFAGPEDPASIERLGCALRELREAQAEVRRLNQTHAAYLRRSGSTIEVLLNAVGNHALTYTRPARSPLLYSLGAGI